MTEHLALMRVRSPRRTPSEFVRWQVMRRVAGESLGTVFLLLLALLTACDSRPGPASNQAEDPELLVARAALTDFIQESDSAQVILLQQEMWARTEQLPDSASWVDGNSTWGLGEAPRHTDLHGAFWRANRTVRRLPASFTIPGRTVQLVAERPDRADGAQIYYISRVGFNAAQDSALVFVASICGPLCGHGKRKLYVDAVGGWKEAATLASVMY